MMKFMLCAMFWIALAFGLNTWVQFGFGTYDATLNSALKALDEARSNALAPLKPGAGSEQGGEDGDKPSDAGESVEDTEGEAFNHSVDLSQLQNLNLQGEIQEKMMAATLARKEYLYRLRVMWILLTFLPLFVGGVFVIRAQAMQETSGDDSEGE